MARVAVKLSCTAGVMAELEPLSRAQRAGSSGQARTHCFDVLARQTQR